MFVQTFTVFMPENIHLNTKEVDLLTFLQTCCISKVVVQVTGAFVKQADSEGIKP